MPASTLDPQLRAMLQEGVVIPAHPLAVDERRQLDERRQRALTRYYMAAGAGGVAVGVHTTQFAIRRHGLLAPVLRLAAETVAATSTGPFLKVAGICGPTEQAVQEAELAAALGYDAGLLSNGGLAHWSEEQLLARTRAVADVIPVFGFYLQPAVGGRVLSYDFWRRFVDIPNVVAIKVAPFNRYQTLDVLRAVADSGRAGEIAVYTGNDDNIVADLITPFRFRTGSGEVELHVAGGLLGHWAVWTRTAVELLARIKATRQAASLPADLLALAAQITDANAAFFDAAHSFAGCIAGIHEVLRRQGLLAGRWCLDPDEDLSPGQAEEIDRVYRAYPHLNDDDFVAAHLSEWLA